MNRKHDEIMKVRNELIFKLAMEGYTDRELSGIFNLPKENINRIIYTLKELKGGWVINE